jgi:transcriptional regulator with GAF, ATPase, and Fis domain
MVAKITDRTARDDEQTECAKRSPGQPVVSLRVRVASEAGPGWTLDSAARALRIGTAPDNDIVLTDRTVSRYHCRVQLEPPGYVLHDLGSTNGTYVDSVRIDLAALGRPARVRVGNTELSIVTATACTAPDSLGRDGFAGMVGRSSKMRELFASIESIAHTDMTVLIEGETGAGKDLVAEGIHKTSSRASGPCVVFDCSAVPPSLIEAELFGHEKGAFTGAVGARPGVFEQADGGTLFLDELGELPKELQPKLLRVMEKREVRRIGSTKTVGVDVRIVAATNRNLLAEVQAGAFRQDLYYRVAAARIAVPPLRERMEDLPLLVSHFLSEESGTSELSAQVWEALHAYSWPGNVRELRNVVRCIAVAPDHRLPLSSTPTPREAMSFDPVQSHLPLPQARRVANDQFERAYLEDVLLKANGSVTRAAAAANVSRQMLTRLVQKHRLREG